MCEFDVMLSGICVGRDAKKEEKRCCFGCYEMGESSFVLQHKLTCRELILVCVTVMLILVLIWDKSNPKVQNPGGDYKISRYSTTRFDRWWPFVVVVVFIS